jgi:Kef-type K+ transport system membrane component KefB
LTLALSLPFHEPALVFVVLFVAVLVGPIAATALRIPGVIGLILTGLLIGPNVTGLIEREGAVELLGGVGLLYLMFVAGVELDLDDFARHRRHSLLFGATTFVVPMAIGTVAISAMGFSTLAAVLLASCWASHTLVAYPVFQRVGVVRNRAVATTVGATIITDTAALMVLAVAARAHQGALDAAFWATMFPKLAAALVAILWILPRLARWFFGTFGQDRALRFLFTVAALYAAAGIAEAAGVEAIVGSFLAGLALNRQIPNSSVLMQQIEFFGSNFLIPVFLISVGMLVDPRLVASDPGTLATAGGFVAIALGTKWLAAAGTGKALGYSRPEIGAMFSLSAAQAAATLAAVFVGLQIGLIDQVTVNAVVLVILVTCLVTSFTADRYGPLLSRPPDKPSQVGQRIVVPVIDDRSTEPLMRLAAHIAAPDSGSIVPVTVLDLETVPAEVNARRNRLVERAERAALAHGAEARALVRLDMSPTAGVLHTVIEHDATAVMLGWRGHTSRRESRFGETLDTLLALSPVPVLVCRPGSDPEIRRVVLSVTPGDLTPAGLPGLDLAMTVAGRIARQADVRLLVVSEQDDPELHRRLDDNRLVDLVIDPRKPVVSLRDRGQVGDVVVAGIPPVRPGLGQNAPRLAHALPERTLVVAAPRGDRASSPGPGSGAEAARLV